MREKVLGLIPAKGGSTRLARKNIRLLGGKPLLAWAGEAARASGVLDRLIVSTEDPEVARVAEELGLEVPFERPSDLARDPAGVSEVALHALDMLERAGDTFATVVIMLPTCPFRTAEDIKAAYGLFRKRRAAFLMSVSPFTHTPFAAVALDEDGLVEPYFPEYFGRKSQAMPPAYRPNGAIHIVDVEGLRREGSYLGRPLLGYVMPPERSIDIDTAGDLRVAEALLASAGGEAPAG